MYSVEERYIGFATEASIGKWDWLEHGIRNHMNGILISKAKICDFFKWDQMGFGLKWSEHRAQIQWDKYTIFVTAHCFQSRADLVQL